MDLFEPQSLPFLMTLQETSKFMRININRVYELSNRKGFPIVVMGRRKMVLRDGLIRWLNDEAAKTAA